MGRIEIPEDAFSFSEGLGNPSGPTRRLLRIVVLFLLVDRICRHYQRSGGADSLEQGIDNCVGSAFNIAEGTQRTMYADAAAWGHAEFI